MTCIRKSFGKNDTIDLFLYPKKISRTFVVSE